MGDYPGEGYKMSAYGAKHYTPAQKKEQWTQTVQREGKVTKGHKASEQLEQREASDRAEQAATGTLPTEKELNVFNSISEVDGGHTYDKIFHTPPGFNQMKHRDDRSHFEKQLVDRSEEEKEKYMPTLSSSTYGRRPPIELPGRDHARVEIMRHTFYRQRGLNLDRSA